MFCVFAVIHMTTMSALGRSRRYAADEDVGAHTVCIDGPAHRCKLLLLPHLPLREEPNQLIICVARASGAQITDECWRALWTYSLSCTHLVPMHRLQTICCALKAFSDPPLHTTHTTRLSPSYDCCMIVYPLLQNTKTHARPAHAPPRAQLQPPKTKSLPPLPPSSAAKPIRSRGGGGGEPLRLVQAGTSGSNRYRSLKSPTDHARMRARSS